MKKNIDYINLDSSLTEWLCGKLKAAPPEIQGASELYNAIRGLAKGESRSLMLEAEMNGGFYVSDKISCGELTIFPAERKVIKINEEISLTPKEFDILLFLCKNRGEVFTKEQIYQAVWDNDYYMDDSNIMAFIRKIRKKIETNPDAPEYILTIWGIGYKLNDRL